MSIYFQYPAIHDYPNLNYQIKTEVVSEQALKDKDKLNQDEVKELKDFLALKPV
ncbi:hypothetical protein [Pedobacter sp. Leaf176]|uniref:hypothetical protein n=1 Tax=Pedobacter sp. Leaf176 TaxID=1736286 RepID=UPI000A63015F|nr:hypothetical protein [Pedobacter sp. Leaf176]